MKSITLKIFNESIKSVHPSELLKKSVNLLNNQKLIINNDIVVEHRKIKFISFGKSGGTMAESLINILGKENILEGIVVMPEQSSKFPSSLKNIEVLYSSHPFVSESSVTAGEKVLLFAENCTEEDTVICLVSGGGSALLASPIDGITIAEKIKVINKLLRLGIGEREVNIIRKKLSKIKGGALAKKIAPARIINLILSDEREHLQKFFIFTIEIFYSFIVMSYH